MNQKMKEKDKKKLIFYKKSVPEVGLKRISMECARMESVLTPPSGTFE